MEESDSVERNKVRRGLYHLLSSAFYPPRSDAKEVWAGLDLVAEPEGYRREALTRLDREELGTEYNRLFVGPASVPCPPYESVHRTDRPEMESGLVLGPSASDARRRYAEAGLVISNDFKDLPDHIAVELEFMCFLCDREMDSKDSSDAEKWRRLQRDFVASHLKPWVGPFANKILASTRSPYYTLAAMVLEAFLADESEYLGIEQRGQA
jgi:TorA maturation chaperone TorD